MENIIVSLAWIALLPVLVSIGLHFLFKIEYFNRRYILRQLIAGVVFGGLAVLGTEIGVPLNGAVINTRDGAVLCGGLIFGGPAGIIAGLIGGIERWFAVYWGAGAYTRTACTISTIVVGFYSAVLRTQVFDDDIPAWYYTLASGVIGEVFHMMMVFVTNMSDPIQAFDVVKACTIPMVTLNALSVFFAVLFIIILDKDYFLKSKQKLLNISQQFQKALVVLVAIAFVLTSSFAYVLQNTISQRNTENLLSININDVIEGISQASDQNILQLTNTVKDALDGHIGFEADYLKELSNTLDIPEISVVNSLAMIYMSTNPDYVGFNMRSGDQSKEFLVLLDGETQSYVQGYQPIAFSDSISMKYAGAVINRGGFVQIGYDADRFQRVIKQEVISVASHRHIGKTGGLVIVDEDSYIISDTRGKTGSKFYGFDSDEAFEPMKVYKTIYDNEEMYVMYTNVEGYKVIAYSPVHEADLTSSLSIHLNTFMEILVFGGLFIFVFFIIKGLIVKNLHKINYSLSKITQGNLDIVVKENQNIEFKELSDGINATVDSLKHFIAEANARIDSELEYAKSIQLSSLPSIFPPFPEYDEFEIYATMNAAKTVGGDFYDFYMIDKDTLAFLVADVSGKSIPGALFMMRAKTTIKTYADAGIAVADIFTNANYNLCEGNDAGMFVTAWMGFLNLKTGELKFANAGHNPPVLRRANGDYEYLRSRPGFVLAGMEGIAYKEQSVQLEPGDDIFLYTDGVTEATDLNKELFGEARLLTSLNSHKAEDTEHICKLVKEDVDAFVGEAEQFDDITMLSLKYLKRRED